MPIYLDNAATSFPKPESVYVAIDRSNRQLAVAAGRGRYQRANDSDRLLSQARIAIARKINVADVNQISFAFSCTDALSTAIFGFLKPGDHAIASVADHNSVLRPLWHVEDEHGVELTVVDCDEFGVVDAAEIELAIKPNTKMVCLTHASNVTGAVQPVEAVGEFCRSRGIAFLVDVAQTIGHLPIDVTQIQCDFLAAPGHKGLMGPLGTGFLYSSTEAAEKCSPLRFGGTGSTDMEFHQPVSCPKKFEAGNLNIPGIAGLLAGLSWHETEEATTRSGRLHDLSHRLATQLSKIDHVLVYGIDPVQTPTISFNIKGTDCQTVGMLLDSQFQIECRTGWHCAPKVHEKIGTQEFGGTVRLSPGMFTTAEEIDQTIAAVQSIAAEMGTAKNG